MPFRRRRRKGRKSMMKRVRRVVAANIETKLWTVSWDQQAVNITTPVTQDFPLIDQGLDINDRIGNKVRVQKIVIDTYVSNSDTNDYRWRIAVFREKGGAFSALPLSTAVDPLTFRIVSDRLGMVPARNSGQGQVSYPFRLTKRYPGAGTLVQFVGAAGSGATMGRFRFGMVTESGAGTAFVLLNGSIQVFYTDA